MGASSQLTTDRLHRSSEQARTSGHRGTGMGRGILHVVRQQNALTYGLTARTRRLMGEWMQLLRPDQPSPNMLHEGQFCILNSWFSEGGRCVASQLPHALLSLCPQAPRRSPQAGGVGVQRDIPHPYGFAPPPPSITAPRLSAPLSKATGALALIRFEAVKSHLRLY